MTIKKLVQKIHNYSTDDIIDFVESNYDVKVKEMISIALHIDEEDEVRSGEVLFIKFINDYNQLRFVRVSFDGKKLTPIDKSEVLPASKAMEIFSKLVDASGKDGLTRALYWKMMVIWGAPY